MFAMSRNKHIKNRSETCVFSINHNQPNKTNLCFHFNFNHRKNGKRLEVHINTHNMNDCIILYIYIIYLKYNANMHTFVLIYIYIYTRGPKAKLCHPFPTKDVLYTTNAGHARHGCVMAIGWHVNSAHLGAYGEEPKPHGKHVVSSPWLVPHLPGEGC